MVVVSTPMGGVEQGMNGSFGRLFGYITGGNQRNEKISMTTPVLISATTNAEQMSFILPKALAKTGAPVPVGTNVMVNIDAWLDASQSCALAAHAPAHSRKKRANVWKIGFASSISLPFLRPSLPITTLLGPPPSCAATRLC